jgi:WD40 repeat protein
MQLPYPDGKYVLTGCKDQIAYLWNIETGLEIQHFIAHTDDITTVAFSPDGKTIATGSTDRRTIIWSVLPQQ